MKRWRYTLHPPGAKAVTRRGRWRETREEAVADAIAAGVASRDDHPGANVFWELGAGVEERDE